MKKILLLALLTLSFQSLAAPREITRTLKDSTTWVALELNEETVFCTSRGYGARFGKRLFATFAAELGKPQNLKFAKKNGVSN